MKAVRPLLCVAVNQGHKPWLLQSAGVRCCSQIFSRPSDLQLLSETNQISETLPSYQGCQNVISACNSCKSVKDSFYLSSRSSFLKKDRVRQEENMQKGRKKSAQKRSSLPKRKYGLNIEVVNNLVETPIDVGFNLEKKGCVSKLSLVSPLHFRNQRNCTALIPAAGSSRTESLSEVDEREIVKDSVKQSSLLSLINPTVASTHVISEENAQTILCEVVKKPRRTLRRLEDIVEQHALKVCKDFLAAAGTEEDIHFIFAEARQRPPPKAAEYSCIYFLELPGGYFYVGQSDNISARIKSHRRRLKAPVRFAFAMLPFGRSHAQKLEKMLIDKLLLCRVPVKNIGDQHRKHFGSATKIL